MRISDWSSDVCSSDLPIFVAKEITGHWQAAGLPDLHFTLMSSLIAAASGLLYVVISMVTAGRGDIADQIGRASWRERVCQYVSISVVAVSLKQKQQITTQHQTSYKHTINLIPN